MFAGSTAAICCGVVGFGFLVAHFVHREETDPETTTSLNLLDAGQSSSPQENLPKEGTPQLVLNIKCVDIRTASVFLESYAVEESEPGLFAFYTLLRNDPLSLKPLYISGLKAHIAISNGVREICSGYGAWLNRAENSISLATGDEARLLLAVLLPEKAEVCAVTNSRSTPLPTNIRARLDALSRHTIQTHLLMGDKLRISVTLIDRLGARHGNFDFGYVWNNGDVQVTKL